MNKGNISIEAQNIMPIIKKWLYSDKDIFIRELVSNGCDAITKHMMVEPNAPDNYRVLVIVDKENKTLCFDDNGIGMTEEEVQKYINQVAFSSAEEFLKNYKSDEKENSGGIIGHFGLGFYSAFMVAKKVSIITKSYKKGSQALQWSSEDGIAYTIENSERKDFGTSVILDIADDELEFLEKPRLMEVLKKYCEFMKVPIYLVVKEDIEKAKAEQEKNKEDNSNESQEQKSPEQLGSYLINDSNPLWLKNPKECTQEEYNNFYHKVFNSFEDPLFQVHLNVDYPFNLKGILYFPRIKRDFGQNSGQIKLFSGQVFVAENIAELIPDYLLLLNGVIDCPDIPLNVSRSYLQNDGFVNKMKAYITRKVADKLLSMFKSNRDEFEKYWDDINPFIKYGCMTDNKFYESVKDILLLKTNDDQYITIKEYMDKNEEKIGKKIYYAADKKRQAAAIDLYSKKDIDVAILNMLIDNSFISFMEFNSGIEGLSFVRVDADVESLTKEDANDEDLTANQEKLAKLFKRATGIEDMDIKLKSLDNTDVPAILLQEEHGRRFSEMSKMYGQNFGANEKLSLVLNNSSLGIRSLIEKSEDENAILFAKQIFDIARMSNRPLEENEITEFIARTNKLIELALK